ncbi:MAG: hypothetical protein WAV90_18495 [Gordonia amarae]
MNLDPDDLLGALVRAATPSDPDARACWALLERAVEAGWIDIDDVRACAVDLTEGNDRGYGEFGLQPYGDVLEVSFLDERYRCATMSFVDTLWVVIRTTGDAGTR